MGLTELDLKATPLVFRDAVMADIPAVVALVESAYRGDSGRRGWTTESDLLEGQRVDAAGVADVIAKSGSRVLLGESGGSLLGPVAPDDSVSGVLASCRAVKGIGKWRES